MDLNDQVIPHHDTLLCVIQHALILEQPPQSNTNCDTLLSTIKTLINDKNPISTESLNEIQNFFNQDDTVAENTVFHNSIVAEVNNPKSDLAFAILQHADDSPTLAQALRGTECDE